MLVPKEVFGISERQAVAHDYVNPNFSMIEMVVNLKELRELEKEQDSGCLRFWRTLG